MKRDSSPIMLQIFTEKEGREQPCGCVTMELPAGENSFGRKRGLWSSVSGVSPSFIELPCGASDLLRSQSQVRGSKGWLWRIEASGAVCISLFNECVEEKLEGTP